MADKPKLESRAGVEFTNLDQTLFDGAGVTKRDLVNYLDAAHDRILPELRNRPLSVIRVTSGQGPFMQKNVPKYTPDWVATTPIWAEASKRTVTYALCNDRRTLLWFANQRAVEYHPTLTLVDRPDHATHLVLDLDPPIDTDFAKTVTAAHLVHQVLTAAGLTGALKTSGAKGLHVFVPIAANVTTDDAAAATRAIARRVEQLDRSTATTAFLKADRDGKVFIDATRSGGATVAAAYSPRARPGLPVSFPVAWDELDHVTPSDFTILNAIERLGDRNPWQAALAAPQMISADLIAEGHQIPIPRVAAMHEGKRRANARRKT
jgi:bifunctional non-homologous end joining protein LigD